MGGVLTRNSVIGAGARKDGPVRKSHLAEENPSEGETCGASGLAALDRTGEGARPHTTSFHNTFACFPAVRSLGEFEGYEFCWLRAGVGYGVGEVAGDPFCFAGFHVGGGVSGGEGLAFDGFFEGQVGDGDYEDGSGVMVFGNDSAGLEFEFGGADGVFDEEDLLGAVVEDGEAAVFILRWVPRRRSAAQGFVVENFDGDVAEGLGAEVADGVGEGGGGEADVAVGEFDGGGRLVLNRIGDFGVAEIDGEVVVAVPVHLSFGVGIDLDVEDAYGFVFESEVMVRLGGDFDFGGLGGE